MQQHQKKYTIAYLMHGDRNIGGGEYSIYYLIKNLRRNVFEPIVFYSHENEIVNKLHEDGVSLVNIRLNPKITSVYRDEIKKNPISLFIYLVYLVKSVIQVSMALKKYHINILHPHDNLSKIIGGIAAKIVRIKVVAHCRDLLKNGFIEKMLKCHQLLFMDRIIAVSESNRRLFKLGTKVPDKVQTIYNGIDLKRFDYVSENAVLTKEELGIDNEKFIVGIIGVFDKCKGHIYLFHAVKKLVEEGYKNIVCLVVGDGREREDLKGFVVNKSLADYIKFLGYRSDIPELLKVMDVVVMPSLHESFPRVPLEAMAMKVPVIATTVGGLPESVENGRTGILVPPVDVDSIVNALRYLIENPAIRRLMGEAGRRRVEERFTIKNNISKTEELYLDVLKIS